MNVQPSHDLAVARPTPHEGQLALCLPIAAWRFPGKTAIVAGEQHLSYGALNSRARRLAHRLISAGIEPGDCVALHMQDGVDLAVSYFGCFYAGAVAVPINPHMQPSEVAYVLEHSGASLYLGQPDLLRELAAIRSTAPQLRRVVSDLRQFEAETAAPMSRRLPHVAADEAAVVIYTAGAAARPKGVTHSHRSSLAAARQGGFEPSDVAAIMTPLAQMAGYATLLGSIDAGATAVLSARFDAEALLDDIAEHRCTRLMATPVTCQELCMAQLAKPRDTTALRRCLAGGDSVPPTLKTTFAQAFGSHLHEVYEMTEAGMIAANWSPAERLRGSCGPAAPDVEIDLADATPGLRGATGEAVVRSPAMMVGYWDDPDATDAAMQDGWLRTGDLVRKDSEGHLWFEGRREEMIRRCGANVSPQEVEAALYQHPAVREAGVVGVPDMIWGELVVAFVSRAPGADVEAEELIAFVGEQLTAHKIPEQVIFLGALPKSPAGKIQRRTLRDMLSPPHRRCGAASI